MLIMSEVKPVIGLEVHCQLTNLKTKLFCSCPADYRGKPPNTNICPVCIGEPGSLPVLNREALISALKVAIALRADISRFIYFSRKNYFYPDLPKNFQISQYDGAGGIPIARDGSLDIGDRVVRIRRIQLEEDPGRIVYEGTITSSTGLLIDYNRSGIALVEIVTEPDIGSPREARIFLERLRSLLEYIGVFDGGLEGAMRCDANISILGGGRVEVKNISSFHDVEKALSFELARQKQRMLRGLGVIRETRHWDSRRRITVSLRVKEEEQDYRYFPEPDLPPIIVTDALIEEARGAMPMLPYEKIDIYVSKYGLSRGLAELLVSSKALSELYDKIVECYGKPDRVASWVIGELLPLLDKLGLKIQDSKAKPEDIAYLLRCMDEGIVDKSVVQPILRSMVLEGSRPSVEAGYRLESRMEEVDVDRIIEEVVEMEKEAFHDAIRNPKALNYLVGLVVRRSGGRADPREVYKILSKKVKEYRRGGV
ncbi:MAG: Asp-tRNA(Asn)/Glu-tRNA(Gln) amidotransferase subunit GatB [Candidatus Bathyarchaeota archaeon]|nr:Asp-tRNA(Asn)/Glu-tRNA(Gln) amidotransferase subunit GatB [Candidatus Bathyarchaeota archaeon]